MNASFEVEYSTPAVGQWVMPIAVTGRGALAFGPNGIIVRGSTPGR